LEGEGEREELARGTTYRDVEDGKVTEYPLKRVG